MPRVIAGEFRGRKLLAPEGNHTRPTSDKVKEALFSIIQFELPEARFLDLFAGSGQMGIEALSRGAEKAVFVDSSRQALEFVNKNLKSLSIEDRAEVFFGNADLYLMQCREKFDIVFLDPPYKDDAIAPILESVASVCNSTAAIICEIPLGQEICEEFAGFCLKRRYRYGKTELALYRQKDAETEIY